MLDTKTHWVLIFLLDGIAKKFAPIPAEKIAIDLKHDNDPELSMRRTLPQFDQSLGPLVDVYAK